MNSFHLISVQAAIFTPDFNEFTQPHFLTSVLAKYADRYDGNIQTLPVLSNVDPNIPRIILEDTKGVWKLQAGPSRVDSFWSREIGNTTEDRVALTHCYDVLLDYVIGTTIRVGRMALVVTKFMEQENPAQVLVNQFCNDESKDGRFRNSKDFEIHNHKVYQPIGIDYKVNSWVRCKTGAIEHILKDGVVIQQDINTLAEEIQGRIFTEDDIRLFFEGMALEAETILRLYFPEGSS
jgi:hypothetical protein